MSDDKILWHYSMNGRQSRKNYDSFMELMGKAVSMAPSTVKFTSPDIEQLEADNKIFRALLEQSRDYFAEYGRWGSFASRIDNALNANEADRHTTEVPK